MFKKMILTASLFVGSAAHAAPNIVGDWITEDRSAVITISRCGSSVCGRIGRALVNKPNFPKTDVHNPKPQLRGRPLIGLQILSGFIATADRWDNGRIYDPESGKTYRSRLKLNPDGSLKVSGCIAFICQSQRWTRAR
jgi:uncharacterized protein (DUF2147 family)